MMKSEKYNKQQQILQHFPTEEALFVKKIIDLQVEVETTYVEKTTDFLTIREQEIIKQIIGKQLIVNFFPEQDENIIERRLACIMATEKTIIPEEFFTILKVSYNNKFYQLRHSDFLGAIMGLGINRKLIGDIFVLEDSCTVFVIKKIATYIQNELQYVGRTPVKISTIATPDLPAPKLMAEQTIVVSSLRIDNILVHIIPRCTRVQVKKMIDQQLITCNWQIIQRVHKEIQVDDVLSIRGFGRVYIKIISNTRKNKYKVIYAHT